MGYYTTSDALPQPVAVRSPPLIPLKICVYHKIYSTFRRRKMVMSRPRLPRAGPSSKSTEYRKLLTALSFITTLGSVRRWGMPFISIKSPGSGRCVGKSPRPLPLSSSAGVRWMLSRQPIRKSKASVTQPASPWQSI